MCAYVPIQKLFSRCFIIQFQLAVVRQSCMAYEVRPLGARSSSSLKKKRVRKEKDGERVGEEKGARPQPLNE